MKQQLQKTKSSKSAFSMFNRVLVLILGFSVSSACYSQNTNHPGGIVDLRIQKLNNDLPVVKYGLHEPTIIDRNTEWQVLVGIGLDTLPGEYLVYIKQAVNDADAYSQVFQIKQKPINQNAFASYKDQPQKTAIHHKTFTDINFQNTQQPSFPLKYPIEGAWTNHFGTSVGTPIDTDQQGVEPINFISLNTTKHSPVQSPQNGIITRIQPFDSDTGSNNNEEEYSYTVFIDHGRGLLSIISGISNLTVKTGNGVNAGTVLGMLTTNDEKEQQAKQLIWQTVLNGEYVNPELLTQINSQ